MAYSVSAGAATPCGTGNYHIVVERYQLAAWNAAAMGSVILEVRAVELRPLVAIGTSAQSFLSELSERGVITVAIVSIVALVAIALGYHRR